MLLQDPLASIIWARDFALGGVHTSDSHISQPFSKKKSKKGRPRLAFSRTEVRRRHLAEKQIRFKNYFVFVLYVKILKPVNWNKS